MSSAEADPFLTVENRARGGDACYQHQQNHQGQPNGRRKQNADNIENEFPARPAARKRCREFSRCVRVSVSIGAMQIFRVGNRQEVRESNAMLLADYIQVRSGQAAALGCSPHTRRGTFDYHSVNFFNASPLIHLGSNAENAEEAAVHSSREKRCSVSRFR